MDEQKRPSDEEVSRAADYIFSPAYNQLISAMMNRGVEKGELDAAKMDEMDTIAFETIKFIEEKLDASGIKTGFTPVVAFSQTLHILAIMETIVPGTINRIRTGNKLLTLMEVLKNAPNRRTPREGMPSQSETDSSAPSPSSNPQNEGGSPESPVQGESVN